MSPASFDGAHATIRSAWTHVDGLRIHARTGGRTGAARVRDVVLVHGVVVSSRYMVPLALELGRDFRVHAPDLPGFGLSEHPTDVLGVADLAQTLVAWLDHCRIERPALVANSFGCQIALHALARRPNRFDCAVLQGPTFDRRAGPLRQGLRWLATGLREQPSLSAIIIRDYADCGLRRAAATLRLALADPVEAKLPHVDVPVLVVRGGADRVVSQRWASDLVRGLPNAELLTLPGLPHALNFSAAPQLAAVVRRFLAAPARRRPAGTARRAEKSIASFDSATAMLRASARALQNRGMDGLGAVPRPLAPLAERLVRPINGLPGAARAEIYRRASGSEGIPPAELHRVSAEAIDRWMVECYPWKRTYAGAIVGSSSGAVTHLAAALGIPFLPQTVLVPVRQPEVAPDQPRHGMEAGRGPAQLLLDANPEWQLHHMHDPNQDRLTLARMAYFRVKRWRLGEATSSFLAATLPRGATLFISDCRLRWPVTRVGERYLFQFGALGGITADEFHADAAWDPPAPDEQAPEAEWGFEPALLDDLREFAERRGLRLRRVAFEDPEDLSPLTADLYRWWYRRSGWPADRLLVESFVLMDPYWAQRTGSVPLWLKFPVEPSAARLERYLRASEPYDDIRLALFSHGADSTGLAHVTRWRSLLERTTSSSWGFLGVDAERFPSDFASFGRFHHELRKLDQGRPLPTPITLGELDEFLRSGVNDPGVVWLDE